MPPDTPSGGRPVTVALLALPESSAAGLYGLHEILGSVGSAWEALTGQGRLSPGFSVAIVGGPGGATAIHGGIPVTPHHSLDQAPRPEIAIVTDLHLSPHDDPRGRWAHVCRLLRAWYEAGTTVCSVCTGSVLLAEAGLLDGKEATCHWGVSGLMSRHYPAVELRPERVLCSADPEGRIVTSGGAASWEDLALHLVARHCGHAEAVRTAKLFLLGDRTEGQLVYSAMMQPRRHEDGVVAACQQWLADNYAVASPVTAMARRSGLAERTFKRRFRAATGFAPIEYVQALRIEEAKQLLETTREPAEAVGRAVGYEDPAFFRRLFRRRTGVTPARYRQRFTDLGAGDRVAR